MTSNGMSELTYLQIRDKIVVFLDESVFRLVKMKYIK